MSRGGWWCEVAGGWGDRRDSKTTTTGHRNFTRKGNLLVEEYGGLSLSLMTQALIKSQRGGERAVYHILENSSHHAG